MVKERKKRHPKPSEGYWKYHNPESNLSELSVFKLEKDGADLKVTRRILKEPVRAVTNIIGRIAKTSFDGPHPLSTRGFYMMYYNRHRIENGTITQITEAEYLNLIENNCK